jgi:hypothetical protein
VDLHSPAGRRNERCLHSSRNAVPPSRINFETLNALSNPNHFNVKA